MDLELENKRVLITGALGGLGVAMVNAFQAEGASVFATGTKTPAEVSAKLTATFASPPEYRQMQLTDEAQIIETVQAIQPEILISNAGLTHSFTLEDLPTEEWRRVVEVNLTGSFILSREAAREMKKRGAGAIVFISSWAQNVPGFNLGAYSASKGGLRMLMQSLAKELAPHGIRVNSLLPGIIEAGMAKRQMDREKSRRKRAKSITPCGRLGTAEEMADAALWLASPRSSFCFGAEILADGGASLGR